MESIADFILEARKESAQVIDYVDALTIALKHTTPCPHSEGITYFGEFGGGFIYVDEDPDNTTWYTDVSLQDCLTYIRFQFGDEISEAIQENHWPSQGQSL